MSDEYVSYKTPSTIVSETVYHFLRGSIYGAAFGFVTPFHFPGSPGAIEEAKTGIFKPAPPFISLRSVPSNALIFGSLLAMQRFGSKTSEFLRSKQDPWNDFVGCAVAYPYYQNVIVRYAIWHNRVIGGSIALAVIFANWS